jgi:DNA-binding transcriptional MerR regulator
MNTGLTVQQSAHKTGLSVHTIRYYERVGLIPSVHRAGNGHRRYSEDDIGWIEFVKCLRSTGMPISEVQRYVKLQMRGDSTFDGRLALLDGHRKRIKSKIQELNGFLKKIEWKIGYYRGLAAKDGRAAG